MYDVIIIGAGISGLVCGCYLAKAGMKVLVVEQHDKPGGYFTSFKRRNFLFDAAAHSFGNYREGGHVRKILTDIGIDRLVEIERYDPSDIVITPDFNITFWNDTKKTGADIARIFPKESENVNNFIHFMTSSDQSSFLTLKDKTFGDLLHSFFKDSRLISSLAFPVFGNGGLPPSLMHAFSGAKIFSQFILDGGYYPKGGIQHLPDALAHVIKENNGTVLYRRLVKKILHKHNSVIGVELDTNEEMSGRYVVAACDMTQTLQNLLGEATVGKQAISSLHETVPSISTFILYLGIDKPFTGLPLAGVNTWYLPHYDLDEIYSDVEKCTISKSSAFMLRVSPDKKTIIAFFGAPFRTSLFWKEKKKEIAEHFLDHIERYIPHLKEHVVYFDAATPSTLHRYTLNYHGAAFGWAKMPSQIFNTSLSKTALIKGLYMAGHWTSIAFGMPGTCYSGYDTAKRILRKEKIAIDFASSMS